MADVFVSYVAEDRAIAERIARGLETFGYSVWWDRHLHGGANFAAEIERQLTAAKTVVVLWSRRSLDSQWVRDEAQQARDENKLVPLRLDRVQPPLGFRQLQCLDFDDWNGNSRDESFGSLVGSIRELIGATSTGVASRAPTTTRRPPRNWSRPVAIVGALLVVVAAALVWRYVDRSPQSTNAPPPIRSSEQVPHLAPKKAVDPRAEEAYLKGIAAREGTSGEQDLMGYLDLEKAIAIAPDWAAPRASLAATYYMHLDYAMMPASYLEPERQALREAKEAAQPAVELDDDSGDAHIALGIAHYLYDWDWDAAERELRRGHELGASDPVLRSVAPGFFFVTGHPTEALGWMREAVAAAPGDAFVRTRQAELSRASGLYDEAFAEANALLADHPGHVPGDLQRLYAMEALGNIDGIREHVQRWIALSPLGFDWLPATAEKSERILQSEGPAAFWRFSAQTFLTSHYFDPVRAARSYVRGGAYDEAFDALEQAYRMKASAILWVPQSAEFAPLRSDARFVSLAERLKLPVPTS